MCPFVDSADPRCAAHLTLREILRAFAHCADRYCECPIYKRLLTPERRHDRLQSAAKVLLAY